MNWIGYILTLVGLICIIRKRIIAWPLLISSNIIYFIYYYRLNDVVALFLFTTYFTVNIIGWITWTHEKKSA